MPVVKLKLTAVSCCQILYQSLGEATDKVFAAVQLWIDAACEI